MKKIASFFQWIVFVIIIPLFVLLIVAGTVLHFSGVDVWGETKEVAEMFDGSEKIEELQSLLEETKDNLEEKDSAEQKLQKVILSKDKEIEGYKNEISVLKEQLKSTEEHKQIQSELIKSYESMSSAKAADILSELDDDQTITILKGLKPETRAKIFENMDAVKAAKYTKGIAQ